MGNAISFLILLLLPTMWLVVSFALAHIGGWATLAREFRNDEPPQGRVVSMCSGSVGGVRYKGTLNLCVSDAGLHLSVLLPFRFGHAPLFIPWTDFHDTTIGGSLLWKTTCTSVGDPAIAQLKLPVWVAEHISGAEESV